VSLTFQPQPRVILAYKNFAANRNICHIGLGVTALNTAKFLRSYFIGTDVWPVVSSDEIRTRLAAAPGQPVTHVVISAPWIPTLELASLAADFPNTQFLVTCHSNLGFLQADPNAMRLVREGLDLERQTWNFRMAANNRRLATWMGDAYGSPGTWVPNLYYVDESSRTPRAPYSGGVLRIGAFGATRPLKNFMTAAGAAVQIASQTRADTELWMSSGRNEGGGCVMDAIRQMTVGLPHFRVVETGWQSWPQFRQTVRHMHLLLQPSYTETFNVVTADGIAEGVPSVVSDAIEWAPGTWKARVDDVGDIARTGVRLLKDKSAARRGWRALEAYNKEAFQSWKDLLSHRPGPISKVNVRFGRSLFRDN
jgi:Family 4 Glycosyltransferase in conflict systems